MKWTHPLAAIQDAKGSAQELIEIWIDKQSDLMHWCYWGVVDGSCHRCKCGTELNPYKI